MTPATQPPSVLMATATRARLRKDLIDMSVTSGRRNPGRKRSLDGRVPRQGIARPHIGWKARGTS